MLSLAKVVPWAMVWISSVYPPGSLCWLSSSKSLMFQSILLCPRLRNLFFPKEDVADSEGGLHFLNLKTLWKCFFGWTRALQLSNLGCWIQSLTQNPSLLVHRNFHSCASWWLSGYFCSGRGRLYLLASGQLRGKFTHRNSSPCLVFHFHTQRVFLPWSNIQGSGVQSLISSLFCFFS